jgi:hypothetical protein
VLRSYLYEAFRPKLQQIHKGPLFLRKRC